MGESCFRTHEAVVPWDDLPEAMVAMQATAAPPETWDLCVDLWPSWRADPAGIACEYKPQGPRIVARIARTEAATVDGCLPHEFAHRWQHLDYGLGILTSTATHHGPEWHERYKVLEAAAGDTWLAR